MSGFNCSVGVRVDYSNGHLRDCEAVWLAGSGFNLGHYVDGPWEELTRTHGTGNYTGFFEMELLAQGKNLASMLTVRIYAKRLITLL